LTNHIHSLVVEVWVKNIYVRNDAGKTSLWFTLNSWRNKLDSRTVAILKRVRDAVANYFLLRFRITQKVAQSFEVTKLDTTIDLKGSFMPSLDAKTLI